MAFESGRRSAGTCTGWGRESFRKRMRKPKVPKEDGLGPGQCLTEKIKNGKRKSQAFLTNSGK